VSSEITGDHIKRAAERVYLRSAADLVYKRFRSETWWRHPFRKLDRFMTWASLVLEERRT
jgi:hypothetical protein